MKQADRPEILARAIRRAGGVDALAAACGISSSAVCQWDRVPTRHLRTVARAGKVPMRALIALSEGPRK